MHATGARDGLNSRDHGVALDLKLLASDRVQLAVSEKLGVENLRA
ncbi:MAG: hypothetical protein QXD46_08635 [Thermofilum sp.]